MSVNYYSIDLIRQHNGQLKVLEIQGSRSAGMKFFNRACGNPGEREVLTRYFGVLSKIAGPGEIYYNTFAPTNIIATSPQVRELLRSEHTAQPSAFDKLQSVHSEYSRASVEEWQHMQRYARNANLPVKFGRSIITLGEPQDEGHVVGLEYLTSDGKSKFHRIERGVYVQRGQTTYPNLSIPIVNDPLHDFILITKHWLALVLGEKTKEYFPEQLFVGMGLASREQVADFVAKHPHLVLKPNFGASSVGVEFHTPNTLQLPELAFSSPTPIDPRFQFSWRHVLNPEAYIPLDFGHTLHVDRKDFGFPHSRVYQRATLEQQGQLDNLVADIAFPLHDMGSSVLQERVDAELVKGKDGKFHKGYIRAFFIDDVFLGAWYRLITEPLNADPLTTMTGVKSTFNPVDDTTLEQVETFCRRLITDYESAIKQRNLTTIQDFVQFRRHALERMISQN